MKKLLLKKEGKGDKLLLVAVALLSIIGTIFIYSASNYSANATYKDEFYFVKKQLIGIVLGIVVMVGIANIDYNKLKKFNILVSVVSLLLLALVFVPGLGVENYGAKRWIGIGSLTIQPSEIAKFSLILFSANYISNNPEKTKTFIYRRTCFIL